VEKEEKKKKQTKRRDMGQMVASVDDALKEDSLDPDDPANQPLPIVNFMRKGSGTHRQTDV
jgi:hypothetical protein